MRHRGKRHLASRQPDTQHAGHVSSCQHTHVQRSNAKLQWCLLPCCSSPPRCCTRIGRNAWSDSSAIVQNVCEQSRLTCVRGGDLHTDWPPKLQESPAQGTQSYADVAALCKLSSPGRHRTGKQWPESSPGENLPRGQSAHRRLGDMTSRYFPGSQYDRHSRGCSANAYLPAVQDVQFAEGEDAAITGTRPSLHFVRRQLVLRDLAVYLPRGHARHGARPLVPKKPAWHNS